MLRRVSGAQRRRPPKRDARSNRFSWIFRTTTLFREPIPHLHRGDVLSASFRGPLLKFRIAVRDWIAFSQSSANVNSRFTTSPEFSLTGQLREGPVSTCPMNPGLAVALQGRISRHQWIVCESQANRFEKSLGDLRRTDTYIV